MENIKLYQCKKSFIFLNSDKLPFMEFAVYVENVSTFST